MQAPVGPAATPELAAAVSEAGGIGSLGASWTEPAVLREQIRAIRRRTDRPFLVNLVLAFDQAERLELLCEEGVPMVSFSWGADRRLIERAHAAGCLVVVQAGSAPEARAAVDAGADALIAQGLEAGGHVQGDDRRCSTWSAELRGGRAGDRGRRDRRRRRPAAAPSPRAPRASSMGTRFVATPEADIHPGLRRAAPRGRPRRHRPHAPLRRRLARRRPSRPARTAPIASWEDAGRPSRGRGRTRARSWPRSAARRSPATRPTSRAARRRGDVETMCLYAGRGCGPRSRSVEPAAEIVAAGRARAHGVDSASITTKEVPWHAKDAHR